MKMIALRALISGQGENELRRILKLKIGGYRDKKEEEEMLGELGGLISSFKASQNADLASLKKLDERVINYSEQRMLLEMHKAAFGSATGQVPARFGNLIKGSLGRLPVVGDHFRAFNASAFFATKQLRKVYSSFGRGVARTAIGAKEMERIQMSVDAERAKGRKAGMLAGWVALSEEEKKLVTLFNIYEKGDALFKRKMQEAKNDILNWLVRKIMEGYGAKLDLNEDQVMQIGLKNANELMFVSMRAGELARIEKQMREILSQKITEYAKAELLMQLMMREQVRFDRVGVLNAIAMLKAIETEAPSRYQAAPGSDKYLNQDAVMNSYRLIRLQKYLEEQFKVNQGIDPSVLSGNKFYFTTGRPELKYVYYDDTGKMRVFDQTFSTYFLSKYRQELERAKPAEKNPVSFMDVANYCFLRIVNERWGLMDPNTAGLAPQVKLVMERAREWLISLANPGIFKGVAPSMADLLGNLYATNKRYAKDALEGAGHGFEHGPVEGTWRMDMKAHWRTLGGAMGGARTSVENQSYKEVNYSHTLPAGVSELMRKNLERGTPISQERAMDLYLKQVTARNLFERMKGILELEAPNAYFSAQREFDYFHNILGAYKEYLARKQGKKEFEVSDREVEKLIQKPIGLKELGEDSWIRLREGAWVPFSQKNSFKLAQADRVVNAMAYIKQDGVWKEFVPEKHLTDGLFRKRMHMLGEFDDITPANNEVLKRYHNLILSLKSGDAKRSDVDSFIGSVADLAKAEARDSRKAMAYTSMLLRLAREDPKVVEALDKLGISIENDRRLAGTGFGDSIRGGVLAQRYLNAQSAQDREAAVGELKAWANGGSPQDNRQMRLALLFYNYGNRINDMNDFNSYEGGIRIAPMGAKSFTSEMGNREVLEQTGGVRNWLRQAFKPLNMEFEQFALSAFAKQTKAEYEASLVSEYYRETGAKFAGKLLAGEFGDFNDRNSASMKTYNSLADSFGRYHAVWDETITRDPRGNSSAIGHSFVFSSFFHHGPAMPFGPAFYKRWITPGMNAPWYSKDRLTEGFKYLQMTPQMFNWMLAAPFIGGYRTFLTSKFGYPSKYDRNYITRENEQANVQYAAKMKEYGDQVNRFAMDLVHSGVSYPEAHAKAERQYAAIIPEKPPLTLDLQRNLMDPYVLSTPRDRDAWRSLTNWFYASFDPSSTSLKRNLSRLVSPLTAFIPSARIHGKIIGNEWNFEGLPFHNPYYVSPQGARAALMNMSGPMIKRQYGGTEIMTGVVRAPEDMWAFQAGVNVIWGNANPGVSYVDFSNTLQMDPRAANFLRYESRFRPYFSHDQYIEKQANLGIAKREIDPTRMMLERNAELRQYRFPENRLYQYLNPATYFGYKAVTYANRAKRLAGDAHEFMEGISTYDGSNRGTGVYGAYGVARGLQFLENRVSKEKIRFKTELRYCSCGSAMPADGVCPACSQKMRCEYCNSIVSSHQTHICQHGLRRNLLMDELQKNGVLNGMDTWKNSSRRWGREA